MVTEEQARAALAQVMAEMNRSAPALARLLGVDAVVFYPDGGPSWPAETMTVRVRDTSAESPWGSGLTNPVVRTVMISAFCTVCGGRRGEPTNLNQCDDGAHYSVDVWTNPYGHTDQYTAVVTEAAALLAQFPFWTATTRKGTTLHRAGPAGFTVDGCHRSMTAGGIRLTPNDVAAMDYSWCTRCPIEGAPHA
jgi:hypothetical protein